MEAVSYLSLTKKEMIFLRMALKFYKVSEQAKTIGDKIASIQKRSDNMTPHDLIVKVCTLAGIEVADITSGKRKRIYSEPRACISNLLIYFFPTIKPCAISRLINKDHATVLHHFKLIAEVKELRNMYEDLKKQIN